MDPFRGYANAIRDELPDAVAVLDVFHVVGSAHRSSTRSPPCPARHPPPSRARRRPALQVPRPAPPRCRTPHRETVGQDHPLPRRRRPNGEVNLARQCYQQLRSIYHAGPGRVARSAKKSLTASTPAPSARSPARSHTQGVATTSAGLLRHHRRLQRRHRSQQPNHRKVRRRAHGFRNLDHYRLRILLAASGQRRYRKRPNHARFRSPQTTLERANGPGRVPCHRAAGPGIVVSAMP